MRDDGDEQFERGELRAAYATTAARRSVYRGDLLIGDAHESWVAALDAALEARHAMVVGADRRDRRLARLSKRPDKPGARLVPDRSLGATPLDRGGLVLRGAGPRLADRSRRPHRLLDGRFSRVLLRGARGVRTAPIPIAPSRCARAKPASAAPLLPEESRRHDSGAAARLRDRRARAARGAALRRRGHALGRAALLSRARVHRAALARFAGVSWEIALAIFALSLGAISLPFGEVVPVALAASVRPRISRWRGDAQAAALARPAR